ncbi:zinc finger protein, putative [Ricinus communis]|uniref:Zinc finger protein, putative n=1 Tax=Ricinus communis TaxID=3988 RepID=B9T6Q4_RICCO|nr:zinc finger protein, putative [Ricinus communis]
MNVALFVFGDSLYDPGNNNYINVSYHLKANRWPYGETFFKFPTGRFCDGRTLPDFIAMKANLPLLRPYLQPSSSWSRFTNGTNFASAGAGVIANLASYLAFQINLKLQLSYFKEVTHLLRQELGEKEAKKLLREAVYLSSIGGNDYNNFYDKRPNGTKTEQDIYVKAVIGNLKNAVKEIYELGGRKFAFQNVGPTGCLPAIRQNHELAPNECAEELLTLERLHNSALLEAAEELEIHLQGFRYSVFDVYTPLYDIIKNPSKYGYLTANFACCGSGVYNASDCGIAPYELCRNPNEYVFFDGSHPTERVNSQLIELFWNGEPKFAKPLNLKQLFEVDSDITLDNYNLVDDE